MKFRNVGRQAGKALRTASVLGVIVIIGATSAPAGPLDGVRGGLRGGLGGLSGGSGNVGGSLGGLGGGTGGSVGGSVSAGGISAGASVGLGGGGVSAGASLAGSSASVGVGTAGVSVGLDPNLPVSLPELPGGINLGGTITNFTSSTPVTKVRCNGMRSATRLSWDRVRVCG